MSDRRVKFVTDGTPQGTKLCWADTGEALPLRARSLTLRAHVHHGVQLVLDVIDTEVDVEVPASQVFVRLEAQHANLENDDEAGRPLEEFVG